MRLLEKVKLNLENRKVKFSDITEQWLEQKDNEIKQSTYANYKYLIEKYLNPQLEMLSIKDLLRYNYNQFIKELTKNLSSKTVKDICTVLKSILKFAEKKYKCNFNIEEMRTPKLNIENVKTLSNREKNKLEKYCLKSQTLRNIGIIVCLYTGLRIGEICAIKWKNIDLEKKEIYVKSTLQRSYEKNGEKTKIIIDSPKTKKSIRSIPISNKLYLILRDLKSKYNEEDFLLTGNNIKVIEPRNYRYDFQKTLKECKIKPYKFHVLRHTFATDCINVGMDIKSLSEILGHSNVNITLNRYVHSSYKLKKKYLEKL